MRIPLILTWLLLSVCSVLSAQESLETILSSDRSFAEMVRQGDEYFTAKHPGMDKSALAIGEHRDGEYVKFQRWQRFWRGRLNPDGSLGDPSAYFLNKGPERSADKLSNPYAGINWTEINYTNYITTQIGLGRTTSLGFHPTDASTFYVGAAIGGIWRTTDGGQSYVPLGDNLPFMAVSGIIVDAADPDDLYIAVSDHVWYGPGGLGIYRSTNGGQSWAPTSLSFSISQSIRIYALIADPTAPGTHYAATGNGLYKTTDGWATNNRILSGDVRDVRLRPGHNTTVYAGMADGRVWRSTDGGLGFLNSVNLGSGIFFAVTPLDDELVYARAGTALYRSDDAGLTFGNPVTLSENNEVVAISPTDADVLLTGNFEIHRSDDAGANFSTITDWLGRNGLPLIHVDQRNIFTNPLEPDAVYYCNDGGVYRYNISANSFDNLSDGLAITQYYDIAVSQTDANVVGGGSQDNGNVFRTADGSWLQYAGTGDGMNQDIDPTDAGTRYWEYQNGGLRRWQNGGNTNIRPTAATAAAWETPFKLDPSNSNRLVAGYDEVFESLDQGDSWTAISSNLTGGAALNELAIAPSNGERIYVTRGGTLYVKNIFDDSWVPRSLPSSSISDIEVDPLDMDKVYVSISGYSSAKVYVSTDAGANWSNLTGSLPNVSVGALELYHEVPGGVFVGTDAGVYYRDDQVTDWLRYGNLPHTRVEDIELQYAAQLIRVGTHGRGVLEAPLAIEICTASSPDGDGDGTCDIFDVCPNLDDNLIGSPCDDGDDGSTGEFYDTDCGCSGGRANLDYCAGQGAAGTGSDYLSYVELNGVENASGKTSYSDFRNVIIPLDIGETYTLTTELRAAFAPDRVHAWMDWNHDGVFEESEHQVLSIPDNRVSTVTFTVPRGAEEGATTMRVRVVYSETFDDPCGSAFGEVEDYTLALSCAAGSGNCGLLPLSWTDFSALPLKRGTALLRWSTTVEENVSHFRVERAYDGVRFTAIGQVPATNLPAADYEFTDETVEGLTAYYRVTSVDLDGAESTTPLERVRWAADETVSVYPNPVGAGGLTVRYPDVAATHCLLYNGYGQEVRRIPLSDRPAGDGATRTLNVPTQDLPAGVYLLRMRGTDWDWTGNVVVR